MKQPSETIQFYDTNAEDYCKSTLETDMESLYIPFLELIPVGGKILDAGCGSGRDTKAFLERGYFVTSFDASARMVELSSHLTGLQTHHMRFQDVDFHDDFDGIWACSSLLHVQQTEIDDVIARLSTALRPQGILYLSFKEGKGERSLGGRHYTDFTEMSLKDFLTGRSEFEIVRIWTSNDPRPNREERWVNALVRKVEN
jgi:SAM-dependent methyltransferase